MKSHSFGSKEKVFGAKNAAWAPYIDRFYHLIAISTSTDISLWKCEFTYQPESREVNFITTTKHQSITIENTVFYI